jgi:hypothetical protein
MTKLFLTVNVSLEDTPKKLNEILADCTDLKIITSMPGNTNLGGIIMIMLLEASFQNELIKAEFEKKYFPKPLMIQKP